jgi:hypothetical protein
MVAPTLSTGKERTMNKSAKKHAKLARPDAHFTDAADVVADGSLSRHEKSEVLESLELDARLLADAASEGMSGGELNKLHDVLQAKDHLAREIPEVKRLPRSRPPRRGHLVG